GQAYAPFFIGFSMGQRPRELLTGACVLWVWGHKAVKASPRRNVMRFKKEFLVLALALAATTVQAANKDFNVKYLLAIQQDGRLFHEARHQNYGFRVEIVDDSQGIKSEASKNGRPYVTAYKGERYSVRLYNPLPVRVAVNLT